MDTDPRLLLPAWDALSSVEREVLARRLCVGADLTYAGLERHEQGGRRHEVACYVASTGAAFVLVPGGVVELGFDPALAGWLTDSIRSSRAQRELPPAEDLLTRSLRPRRVAHVRPVLLECHALELAPGAAVPGGTSAPGGTTLAGIEEALAARGFRLPAVDEWEHACRGGATTLFRWGDQCPMDRSPSDHIRFDEHLRSNAFGLHIADGPLRWELASGGELVGGDGGNLARAGAAFPLRWLPLACAWRNGRRVAPGEELPGVRLRRARDIPARPAPATSLRSSRSPAN